MIRKTHGAVDDSNCPLYLFNLNKGGKKTSLQHQEPNCYNVSMTSKHFLLREISLDHNINTEWFLNCTHNRLNSLYLCLYHRRVNTVILHSVVYCYFVPTLNTSFIRFIIRYSTISWNRWRFNPIPILFHRSNHISNMNMPKIYNCIYYDPPPPFIPGGVYEEQTRSIKNRACSCCFMHA